MQGHNNPPIVMELSHQDAIFLQRNIDTNMGQMLGIIQLLSPEGQEKIVSMLESFRSLRTALDKAGGLNLDAR